MSRDTERYKILVTHPELPSEVFDLLSKSGEVITCQSVPPKRAEILEKVRGVHGILWASHEPLNAEVLDAAGPQLKAVSTMSGGVDFVNVPEFKKRKISLGYTPNVMNGAVADLAIGLMIAAARRFHEARRQIDTGNWQTGGITWMCGKDICCAVVGFFGFGGIGQAIAKRLSGFDVACVLYNTHTPVCTEIEKELSARHVSFDELLAKSDILFIAVPLTNETKGVFNATAFAKMKKTAVLINIARGQIVNQHDLYDALSTNKIFAAGLDVMTPEPLPANDPLLSLPNCVILPHIGTATTCTRNIMATTAAQNVLQGLRNETMPSPVCRCSVCE